jgi:hypothetical protein
MKYVKLFENWLNEAEEGKSEVKPFDPNKPEETLVVDITQNDLREGDIQKNLGILLSKCIDKTEKKDNPNSNLNFQSYTLKGISWKGDIATLELELKGGNTNYLELNQNLKNVAGNLKNNYEDSEAFYVSLYEGEDWINDKKYIKRKPKSFLIIGLSNPEVNDFALNSESMVITLDEKMSFASKTTLGTICAFATTKFENIAELSNKQAGTPQNIAKLLGYEIPDNYAPKDGGIEVTTK